MCCSVIPYSILYCGFLNFKHKGLSKMKVSLGAYSLRFNYSITNSQQMFLNYLA
jgi:hypothetical protein